MNKKGIWDDLVDIAWTAAIVIIAIFLFSTFLQSSEKDVKKEVGDKDSLIEREAAMINFLRTPVKLIKPDFEEDLTVQEVISLYAYDSKYKSLLEDISRSKEFKNNLFVIYNPDPLIEGMIHTQMINRGDCKGKSSVAYIPTYYSEKIEHIKIVFRYCP